MILSNARIYQGSSQLIPGDLRIEDGFIREIGYGLIPREGEPVHDLKDGVLLPGFADSHVHFFQTGFMDLSVDLSGVADVAEVIDRLRAALVSHQGGPLIAHSFDPSETRDGRYPTRVELDAVSTEVPILVRRRDGHSGSINGRALAELPVPVDTPGIERDALGAPTGVLRQHAFYETDGHFLKLVPRAVRIQAARNVCHQAAARGVTGIHALLFWDEDVRLVNDLRADLPIRLTTWFETWEVAQALELGLDRIGGCLFIDGSIGSKTAAFSVPYTGQPGNFGQLYNSDRKLFAFVEQAHRAGLQMAFHAIGDRAVEQVLRAYEWVLDADPREDARHCIEHAEYVRPYQLERIRERGIVLSMQPAFEAFWGGPDKMYSRHLPKSAWRVTNPFRSIVDAGITVAGGSDSFVTPIDPLAGISAAMGHPNLEEKLTFVQALGLFTEGAAYRSREEKTLGRIAPGYVADLVLLGENPAKVAVGSIPDIPVLATWCRGQCIFTPPRPPSVTRGEEKDRS